MTPCFCFATMLTRPTDYWKLDRLTTRLTLGARSVPSIENLNALFGYNIYGKNDKPTNGEFIALVADKLLMEEQGKKAG